MESVQGYIAHKEQLPPWGHHRTSRAEGVEEEREERSGEWCTGNGFWFRIQGSRTLNPEP